MEFSYYLVFVDESRDDNSPLFELCSCIASIQHYFNVGSQTTLSEQGFAYDVSECLLAHKVGSAVSQSYNYSTYFDQRKKIIEWWGAYVSECSHRIASTIGAIT